MTPAGQSIQIGMNPLNAVLTPDGKYLLATVSPERGKVYENKTLVRFGWPGASSPTPLAKNLDLSVDKYVPAPDSQTIYFIAEDKGYVRVFVAPISGSDGRAVRDPARTGLERYTLHGKDPGITVGDGEV